MDAGDNKRKMTSLLNIVFVITWNGSADEEAGERETIVISYFFGDHYY